MKKKRQKKQLNKYVRFSGIAFQLGITMYLAAYFGKRLDDYYGLEKQYFALGFIILALVLSIWSLTVQLKNIDNE